jgi:hypothetical protein
MDKRLIGILTGAVIAASGCNKGKVGLGTSDGVSKLADVSMTLPDKSKVQAKNDEIRKSLNGYHIKIESVGECKEFKTIDEVRDWKDQKSKIENVKIRQNCDYKVLLEVGLKKDKALAEVYYTNAAKGVNLSKDKTKVNPIPFTVYLELTKKGNDIGFGGKLQADPPLPSGNGEVDLDIEAVFAENDKPKEGDKATTPTPGTGGSKPKSTEYPLCTENDGRGYGWPWPADSKKPEGPWLSKNDKSFSETSICEVPEDKNYRTVTGNPPCKENGGQGWSDPPWAADASKPDSPKLSKDDKNQSDKSICEVVVKK